MSSYWKKVRFLIVPRVLSCWLYQGALGSHVKLTPIRFDFSKLGKTRNSVCAEKVRMLFLRGIDLDLYLQFAVSQKLKNVAEHVDIHCLQASLLSIADCRD